MPGLASLSLPFSFPNRPRLVLPRPGPSRLIRSFTSRPVPSHPSALMLCYCSLSCSSASCPIPSDITSFRLVQLHFATKKSSHWKSDVIPSRSVLGYGSACTAGCLELQLQQRPTEGRPVAAGNTAIAQLSLLPPLCGSLGAQAGSGRRKEGPDQVVSGAAGRGSSGSTRETSQTLRHTCAR